MNLFGKGKNEKIAEQLQASAEEIASRQSISEDPKKGGAEVYALYVAALPEFRKWWEYIDRCQKYYRGEAKPATRGKNRTNANHNIVFADIETLKPAIRANLVSPTLYAETPDGLDAGRKLNLRTENAWRDSGVMDELQEEMLQDVTVDGTEYLKTIYDKKVKDVRVVTADARRIMFDPSVRHNFHKSWWVMDVTTATKAEIEEEIKGANVEAAGPTQLESEKGMPSGPVPVGLISSNAASSIASQTPPGGVPTVVIYGGSAEGGSGAFSFSDSVKRVLKIEMWLWDRTKNAENAEKADGGLKYPEGRRLTVAVGIKSKDGKGESALPETVVLEDIKNPCVNLARQLHEFPIVQIQCHKVKQILGLSEASVRADMQDLVNDALNQMHDNWRFNNSPVRIVHKRYGLNKDNVINAPDNVIVIDAPVEDVRRAIAFDRPPSMIGDAVNVLGFYLKLNEEGGGAVDAMAGRNPGGDSGVAIAQLQTKAQGRFYTIAKNINGGCRKAYAHVALCAQDFDSKYGEPIWLINEESEHDKPDSRYVKYDPAETEGIKFKIEIGRKLSAQEVMIALQGAAQMESVTGIPGMGELILEHLEERKLLLSWRQLRKNAEQAAQKEREYETAADAAKQRFDAAKRISVKALEVASERNNNVGKTQAGAPAPSGSGTVGRQQRAGGKPSNPAPGRNRG